MDAYRGTPPNHAELETSRLISLGVPAEAAGTFSDRIKADSLRIRRIVAHQQRMIRLRNRGYAPGPFRYFANRERFIRSKLEG